jgi:hypothetical protein
LKSFVLCRAIFILCAIRFISGRPSISVIQDLTNENALFLYRFILQESWTDEQANNNEEDKKASVCQLFFRLLRCVASRCRNDLFALVYRWLLVLNRKRIFKIRGRRQALIQVEYLSLAALSLLLLLSVVRITVRTNVVTVKLSPIVNTVATVLLSSPLLLCF